MVSGIEVVSYKVKKGDSFWNIVKAQGFPPNDWEKIYKASYNSKLKKLIEKESRTPDTIFPGEIIFLPAYKKSDIEEATKNIKAFLKSVSTGQAYVGAYQKALGELKKKKEEDRSGREVELDKLVAERNKLDTAIVEGSKSYDRSAGGVFSKYFARAYLRKNFDIAGMDKTISETRKNLDTGKFDASIKKLESMMNLIKKDIDSTSAEAKAGEKDLAKMLKSPY